jgi:hypothetical protein
MNKRNFIKAAVLGAGALLTNEVMASDIPKQSTFEPDCVSISDRECIGYIKYALGDMFAVIWHENIEFRTNLFLDRLKENNKIKEYKCIIKNKTFSKVELDVCIKPIETDIWIILDIEVWVNTNKYNNSLIK